MNRPQRIGFVGLGMMGGPMVECLASKGFDLFISDADSGRAERLRKQVGAAALDAASLGSLDALITMLPNSAIVEKVLLGDGDQPGLARSLPRGATVIDMSSSEPGRSRDLGRTLGDMGLSYLDAPVSGGVKRAVNGTLAILVGGSAAGFERFGPLLGAMGTSLLHIGDAGSGHAAKALNNYVSAAALMATAEALHVAARFGIDPKVMTDVLNVSSGRTNTSENKVAQFMLNGNFASGFAMQLMAKDLRIADALARSVDYEWLLGATAVALWVEKTGQADPAADHTEMYRLLQGQKKAQGQEA
jgi:3-hydroxyisobutyrate dehydrogenase